MWYKGFDAGVAFTIRQLTSNGSNVIDINNFITELSNLRTWKSREEWKDFVERNIVEGENGNG